MRNNLKLFYFFSTIILIISFLMLGAMHSLSLLFFLYIIKEAVLSDHIEYPSSTDYKYEIKNSTATEAQLPEILLTDSSSTNLLEINISSNLSGFIFDPYVEMTSDTVTLRQYFERGVNGKRFLNLQPLVSQNTSKPDLITIKSKFCNIPKFATLHQCPNNLSLARIMVIAPHPDDAEIAAFGLYSQNTSHIVTITAGEVEPETFSHFSDDPVIASQLKGLARAWDSISIPLWGDQPIGNTINLGYFCMQLSKMYSAPSKVVSSRTAGISNTSPFSSDFKL